MKRLILPAALALALSGTLAFAQQPDGQPPPPDATAQGPMYGRHHRHPPSPERQAHMLGRRLNLSADQTQKLVPIFADRDQKSSALRENTALTPDQRHEQMRALMQSTNQQLATVLTPDQLEQMRQMRHNHRGRRGGPDQGPNQGPPQGPDQAPPPPSGPDGL